ncbi:pyridoxal phosphate-dependent transferase [Boeremia exigua]|uniref:pyridoxal phosphate-dependent transferase n=1 Tax=Boeremia exigua TaxID=749465 RepID=UPI001E8D321C|nr:pyridoxal phosphate-dependent transferase [Boeremia exigua]KAH6639562.1 pyridoxal phosphate-dependent transferase [Boeremia exigua]
MAASLPSWNVAPLLMVPLLVVPQTHKLPRKTILLRSGQKDVTQDVKRAIQELDEDRQHITLRLYDQQACFGYYLKISQKPAVNTVYAELKWADLECLRLADELICAGEPAVQEHPQDAWKAEWDSKEQLEAFVEHASMVKTPGGLTRLTPPMSVTNSKFLGGLFSGFKTLDLVLWFCLFAASAIYGGVHLFAWNDLTKKSNCHTNPHEHSTIPNMDRPPSPILTLLATHLRVSATLQINERVQARLQQGHKVVHLGFGEATFPIHPRIAAAHRDASLNTSYAPAIARFQTRRLGAEVAPEQVVVAPGSKPLLFALFDILAGDVLLPRPSWVSYEPQVLHAGKRVFWVETSEHDRHAISESALRETYEGAVKEGARPRVLLVNSPSNPTGGVYSQENIDGIVKFCEEFGVTLISDEIYADIFYGKERPSSPGAGGKLNSGNIILTGGLSKTYSAGGWRVGYAVFPNNDFGKTVQAAILAYASECWSAASAPAQEAATVAFDTSPEMDVYRTQVAALHKRCTLELYQALKDCGLDVPEPQGAFYIYPSFQPFAEQLQRIGIKTSAELSTWLITECGIATLPGSAFGEDDQGVPGGRYRLRMATSYLYFQTTTKRYELGPELLASAVIDKEPPRLPLLQEAIKALESAVAKLRVS